MPELARIEAVVFLQSVDLFSHCRAEEVLRIASISGEKEFQAGEEIYAVNDAAEMLYCVVRGSVRLESSRGGGSIVGPLHTFGFTDILSGRLRGARAIAESDTLVLTVEADDFFDLLANNIEIVKALFRHLLVESQGAPSPD